MLRPRSIVLTTILSLLLLAACGDGGGDTAQTSSTTKGDSSGATKLMVTGVATRAGGDPAAPTEVPFSGEVECGGKLSDAPGEDQIALYSGTGAFATSAPAICRQLADVPDVFDLVGDQDRICTEIYGGPQTARVEGTIDGAPVDVDVARNDGCGIDDWTTLEFLLGAPEQ